MNVCFIGIGSNIDPEENIAKSLKILKEETNLIAVSSFIITKPIGITAQPDFLNGAAKLETLFTLVDFRFYLKSIEDRLGRDRTVAKYGPRCIDLDVIVWNGQIVDDDYHTRGFVKNALQELNFPNNNQSH